MLLLFLLVPLSVGGCAEAVRGPRVVTYSEDRFYVRHVPVIDSRDDVDLLATAICAGTGRVAGLESAEQFAPLDIRYATYRCSEVVEPTDGSRIPSEPERGA
ncbi:MAG: hypothetical protein IPK78_05175 [Rhodospirillales bacterium]|nr:hypothetical protein [Rhodospirillales bacterium]